MPTGRRILRERVIAEHGNRCVVCKAGPLTHRALFIGMIDGVHVEPRPLCKHCIKIAEAEDVEAALVSRLRVLARAYDALWNMSYMRDNTVPIPEPKAYRDAVMLEAQYYLRRGEVPS
jgi:hypothetical protein